MDLDEKVLDGSGEGDTEEFVSRITNALLLSLTDEFLQDNEMGVSDEQEDSELDDEKDVSNEEQYESGSGGERAGFGSEVSDSGNGKHDMDDAVEKATKETNGQSSGTSYGILQALHLILCPKVRNMFLRIYKSKTQPGNRTGPRRLTQN